MESDADRRNMLLALGGSDENRIGERSFTGLFQREPLQSGFDEISVSGDLYTLRCLMSDIRPAGVKSGDPVAIPDDESSYFIADIQNEDGLALLLLRKE